MTTALQPAATDAWVAAAPFRAHLAHVVQHTGVPWPVVAMHAGVPFALARHLLFGRRGRRLARLPHHVAERLLRVTIESVRDLRQVWLDAAPVAHDVLELARRGMPPHRLPAAFGLSPGLLAEVADGEVPFVTADVVLGVRAALAWADQAEVRDLLFRRDRTRGTAGSRHVGVGGHPAPAATKRAAEGALRAGPAVVSSRTAHAQGDGCTPARPLASRDGAGEGSVAA